MLFLGKIGAIITFLFASVFSAHTGSQVPAATTTPAVVSIPTGWKTFTNDYYSISYPPDLPLIRSLNNVGNTLNVVEFGSHSGDMALMTISTSKTSRPNPIIQASAKVLDITIGGVHAKEVSFISFEGGLYDHTDNHYFLYEGDLLIEPGCYFKPKGGGALPKNTAPYDCSILDKMLKTFQFK